MAYKEKFRLYLDGKKFHESFSEVEIDEMKSALITAGIDKTRLSKSVRLPMI